MYIYKNVYPYINIYLVLNVNIFYIFSKKTLWKFICFRKIVIRPKAIQKRSKNATSIFHQPVSPSFRIQNYLEFSFSISCCASIADVCRFLTFYHFASSDRCPWGAAVSLCVYNDILKVLAWYVSDFVTRFAIDLLYFFYSDFW